MLAPWMSRTWLVVSSIRPQKIEACWAMSTVAKATPKMMARYLPRLPVSIRKATQIIGEPRARRACDENQDNMRAVWVAALCFAHRAHRLWVGGDCKGVAGKSTGGASGTLRGDWRAQISGFA